MAVLYFSLGLAVAMVGFGMVVVTGFLKIAQTGRFDGITRMAPVLGAALVVGTGVAALMMAH